MNNKKYIILLGSFIACTSMGMDDMDDDTQSQITWRVQKMRQDFKPRVLYNAVQNEVQALKKAGQLTPETLLRNMQDVLSEPEALSARLDTDNIHHFRFIFEAITKIRFQTKAIDSFAVKKDGTQCAIIEKDNLALSVWKEESPAELIPVRTFNESIEDIFWIDGGGKLLVLVKGKETQHWPYAFNSMSMAPVHVSEVEVKEAAIERQKCRSWGFRKLNEKIEGSDLPANLSERHRRFHIRNSSESETATMTTRYAPSLDEIAHYLCAQAEIAKMKSNSNL